VRISSSPDDPAYSTHFHLCDVFLEGAARNNVLLADEDKRFAIQFRRDEFGQPVIDKKTGAQVVDRFYGAVRISCPDWLRAGIESPDEADTLSAAIMGMIAIP
jgi:hypothetical protein